MLVEGEHEILAPINIYPSGLGLLTCSIRTTALCFKFSYELRNRWEIIGYFSLIVFSITDVIRVRVLIG